MILIYFWGCRWGVLLQRGGKALRFQNSASLLSSTWCGVGLGKHNSAGPPLDAGLPWMLPFLGLESRHSPPRESSDHLLPTRSLEFSGKQVSGLRAAVFCLGSPGTLLSLA